MAPRRPWLAIAAVAVGTPVACALVYLYVTVRESKIKGLPGPKPTPILGYFPESFANRKRRLKKINENADKYGPNWVFTIPNFKGHSHFSTVDPAVVEHILKTNFENYVKGEALSDRLKPLLGRNFRSVVGTVVATDVTRLVAKLLEAADTGTSIDLHQYFHNFTLDSFGRIGFGDDFGCLDTPADPPPFARAFDSALEILVMRFINLFWRTTETLWPGKPSLKDHIKVIDEFAMERIRLRREKIEKGGQREGRDLLDLFMEVRREDGEPLSDQQLRDVILNMILAGRDTTAQALSWTFLELTRNPWIVAGIREEVQRVLGAKRIPTFDEIPKLKYCNAVFMETMRLHPSVPGNVKISVKEDILPGGIHIPAKTSVFWFPYAMGRRTAIWGPDAATFNPLRWIEPDGSLRRVSPFSWIAFNAGPRVCLGQQMATVESVMAIVGLCNELDFETVVKGMDDPDPSLSLTNCMRGGLPVFPKRATKADVANRA
ncbi:hypothetical protein HK101_002496 [Irineochytrium annulatum]|nr:hypothetical protein HK101_002496 [Irineochytrium annulatum]